MRVWPERNLGNPTPTLWYWPYSYYVKFLPSWCTSLTAYHLLHPVLSVSFRRSSLFPFSDPVQRLTHIIHHIIHHSVRVVIHSAVLLSLASRAIHSHRFLVGAIVRFPGIRSKSDLLKTTKNYPTQQTVREIDKLRVKERMTRVNAQQRQINGRAVGKQTDRNAGHKKVINMRENVLGKERETRSSKNGEEGQGGARTSWWCV